MRLILQSTTGEVVAERELTTKEDYSRVADASILTYQGRYYSFTGIRPNTVRGSAIFTECTTPVSVDGFIEGRN